MAIEPQPHPSPKPATESLPAASSAASDSAASNFSASPTTAALPGPRRSIVRSVLLAVFLAVSVVFGVDQFARYQVHAACDAVDALLESRGHASKASAEQVHALLGREPDEAAEPPERIELYRWRGILHSFTLFVAYDRDGLLRQVSVDARPPAPRSSDATEPMDGNEPG
jgi:hypothetical protein